MDGIMEESHVYSCFYEAQEGAIESNYILELDSLKSSIK